MTDYKVLTDKTAQRVNDVVRRYPTQSQQNNSRHTSPRMEQLLIGSLTLGTYYQATPQRFDGTSWISSSGTNYCWAYQTNGGTLTSGQYVQGIASAQASDGRTIFLVTDGASAAPPTPTFAIYAPLVIGQTNSGGTGGLGALHFTNTGNFYDTYGGWLGGTPAVAIGVTPGYWHITAHAGIGLTAAGLGTLTPPTASPDILIYVSGSPGGAFIAMGGYAALYPVGSGVDQRVDCSCDFYFPAGSTLTLYCGEGGGGGTQADTITAGFLAAHRFGT